MRAPFREAAGGGAIELVIGALVGAAAIGETGMRRVQRERENGAVQMPDLEAAATFADHLERRIGAGEAGIENPRRPSGRAQVHGHESHPQI